MDNRRNFFRLDLYNVEAWLDIEGTRHKGRLLDISGNGLKWCINKDLAFENAYVEFQLGMKDYSLVCELIHKKPREGKEVSYACRFSSIDEKTQSQLVSELLKMDAKRRRK